VVHRVGNLSLDVNINQIGPFWWFSGAEGYFTQKAHVSIKVRVSWYILYIMHSIDEGQSRYTGYGNHVRIILSMVLT
jgi:hypothetical protein